MKVCYSHIQFKAIGRVGHIGELNNLVLYTRRVIIIGVLNNSDLVLYTRCIIIISIYFIQILVQL